MTTTQELRQRLAAKKDELLRLRRLASTRRSGMGWLGAAGPGRVPQNKKQCEAAGGSWDKARRCCVGISCAAPAAGQGVDPNFDYSSGGPTGVLQAVVKNKKQCEAQGGIWTAKGKVCQILPVSGPGARLPAANKKQCQVQGGVWTAKGKICQVPPRGSDVPGGAVPSTKPWFQPPVTKPGVQVCPAILIQCPSTAVKLDRSGGGCTSACLDASGNVVGYGNSLAPLPVVEGGGEGSSEGGVDVGTIRPQDLLTEFDGSAKPDVAATEKPWYTKPVLGIPVGVAVALGVAGLWLWQRKGGGAKRIAYSRRKAKRLTRR